MLRLSGLAVPYGVPVPFSFQPATAAAVSTKPDPSPPSPQEIADRAAAIRAEWTEAERLRRLRPDWRPQPVVHRLHRVGGGVSEPLQDVDR